MGQTLQMPTSDADEENLWAHFWETQIGLEIEMKLILTIYNYITPLMSATS